MMKLEELQRSVQAAAPSTGAIPGGAERGTLYTRNTEDVSKSFYSREQQWEGYRESKEQETAQLRQQVADLSDEKTKAQTDCEAARTIEVQRAADARADTFRRGMSGLCTVVVPIGAIWLIKSIFFSRKEKQNVGGEQRGRRSDDGAGTARTGSTIGRVAGGKLPRGNHRGAI